MNDNLEDRIDSYIQNRMTSENKIIFEEELSRNEELSTRVKSVAKLKEGYIRKDIYQLKEKLDVIGAELDEVEVNNTRTNIFKKYKFLSLAASIAVLFTLGYFAILQQNKNEFADLFEKNTPYNKFVTRSQDNPFATLNELLQDKQYDEVIKHVDGLLMKNNKLNEDIVLLLEQGKAYALIASEEYENASQILDNKNDCYSTWLKWCLIKKSDVGDAEIFREKLNKQNCHEHENTLK